jgi:hypothetical protein
VHSHLPIITGGIDIQISRRAALTVAVALLCNSGGGANQDVILA